VDPEPDLRAFARFRIILTDVIVGQEGDAVTILDEMRQKDADNPYLPLALLFWDTYGMTADLQAACTRVTRSVEAEPSLYLRSLNGWASAPREFAPSDVCRVP
jgi:hypothetical protein